MMRKSIRNGGRHTMCPSLYGHFTPFRHCNNSVVKHGFKLAEQHPMPFDAFYVSMLTERYKGSRLSFLKGMWTGLLAWFSSLAKKNAVVQ